MDEMRGIYIKRMGRMIGNGERSRMEIIKRHWEKGKQYTGNIKKVTQ